MTDDNFGSLPWMALVLSRFHVQWVSVRRSATMTVAPKQHDDCRIVQAQKSLHEPMVPDTDLRAAKCKVENASAPRGSSQHCWALLRTVYIHTDRERMQLSTRTRRERERERERRGEGLREPRVDSSLSGLTP